MSPNGGGEPEGALAEAIARDFGSFAAFQAKMSQATVAVQGSGWGWLGFNKEAGRLQVATCANQDPLEVKIFYTAWSQNSPRRLRDLSQLLESTFGSTLITFNTKTSDQTTSTSSGTSPTGKMLVLVSLLFLPNSCSKFLNQKSDQHTWHVSSSLYYMLLFIQ